MVDVALKSGVGVSTVWLIENGYIARVSNKTKRKIAKGLSLRIGDLFPLSNRKS
jgi:DNA-binding LacI/PurR family transcriptional regulator